MGTPKAALEWHGSTLLRRTVGILARVTDGPVVVVRAPGQDLPALPGHTEVVDDPREGLGPVQGLAAGLAALKDRAEVAFVSSTDMPFLHPAFVRRVLRAAQDGADVGLPVARGYPQPLAASYRTRLVPVAERLVAEERLRPAFLFEECVVDRLDEDALLADPVLAAFDPGIESVVNVNELADFFSQLVIRAAQSVDGARVRRPRRSVEVAHAGGRASVSLDLAVSHGAIVPELAHTVQERVAQAVGTACGIEIERVDLSIEEIA